MQLLVNCEPSEVDFSVCWLEASIKLQMSFSAWLVDDGAVDLCVEEVNI